MVSSQTGSYSEFSKISNSADNFKRSPLFSSCLMALSVVFGVTSAFFQIMALIMLAIYHSEAKGPMICCAISLATGIVVITTRVLFGRFKRKSGADSRLKILAIVSLSAAVISGN